MPDTVNSAGVRCFPSLEDDLGWRSVMPGFTDACFPAAWLRIKLPTQVDPRFDWLEGEGVVCSVAWGFPIVNNWNFSKRVGLVNLGAIVKFLPTMIGGNPATQVQAEILYAPDFGPNVADQWVFDRLNVSKVTPWTANSCGPILGGPGCTSNGPMVLDWWPSACGVPEPGPTVPE